MPVHPAWRFRKLIESHAPSIPQMPAMHSCLGRQFVSILDSKIIKPGPVDEIINKSVSFLFYGKPSYKPNNNGLFSSTIWSALFTIILDLDKIPNPVSALPFDSGGYLPYLKDICQFSPIEDYFLEDAQSPQRYVATFFGDNSGYYETNLDPDIDSKITELDFHSQSICAMCRPNTGVKYDLRASSIELHVEREFLLTRENVLAVIGPSTALEADEVISFAQELEAELVPYKLDHDNVDARQRQIRDTARPWLRRVGYIL
jgi:hypothetical protein